MSKLMKSQNQKNILFVCSGNVFRSVFAEGYTKHLLKENGLENINIFSCGTIAEEKFRIPESIKKLFKLYNIKEKDLSKHIPTKINEELLSTADIILVMDKSHLDFIKQNFKDHYSKTFLLKDFAGFYSQLEIFDPIGQPEEVYIKTAEEIKICIEAIIEKTIKNRK